jgi:hypothetical protein
VLVTLTVTGIPHQWTSIATANAAPDHLVISEVVTGATSASDELIELYNPTGGPLPLEGLELVYASASGLTVSRRAAWELGAPEMPPGGHLLIANELGVYAPIADATYASGMAATGGSVALRIVGASSAIDAVGWGSAASTWLEGTVAPAPPAGSSLERLPGGALGSTQDTGDNAADFVVRPIPGPENSASPPVPDPSASSSPQPSAPPSAASSIAPTAQPTAAPTLSPTVPPTASPPPGPAVASIATARALPDGTEVTIEGVAITGSDFADGGGHVADDSGGLAVLVSDGSFGRGDRLRVSGVIDDRYAQRTLRADFADVVVLGAAADPPAMEISTGSVGEGVESRLLRIAGTIVGSPTTLSTGLAFDVDDGSGSVRLLIGSATGIDVAVWGPGFQVDAIGVVGQRDSSGTGASGYRVQPRDAADILAAGPAPSPTPSPGASATPEATAEPSPSADVIRVAAARRLPKGASAVVRGVVTLAPGLVDPTTAALQDASGAIALRIGDEAGPIARGSLVELRGIRSTLGGMETLRVTTPPRPLGAVAEPDALPVRTGEAGEAHEAVLVTARGGLVAAPRRSSAGTISFEIDDGSGPLRVSVGSTAGVQAAQLAAGTWIEVRGVLGQETTGSLPLRGYRIWPRDAADLRVTAPAATTSETGSTGGGQGSAASDGVALDTLDAIGGAAADGLPVGATLVVGPWKELGLGGLLWDGTRLVALHDDAAAYVASILRGDRPPVAVQATGLRIVGVESSTGIPVAAVSNEPGALVPGGQPVSPPVTTTHLADGEARWVTLVGRLAPGPDASTLLVGDTALRMDRRCQGEPMPRPRTVSATGILVDDPERLVVPCGGIGAAPTLHRSTTRAAVEPAASTRAVTGDGTDPRPEPLPATLLLLAAAVLAGGAAAARRPMPDGPPGTDSGEVAAEPEDEAASPPVLTLVPMPRERAP